MVLADQDRLGTAQDPTGPPLDSVADGHHVEAGNSGTGGTFAVGPETPRSADISPLWWSSLA